jgi:uncharacterized protein YifE (UPF0438 family)
MENLVGLNKIEFFPYYDDMHFPYGFARSGYFTKKQAEILTSYGRHLRELWTEEILPKNKVEKNFVTVCQGKLAAVSEIEKTWLAYLSAIKQVTCTLNTSYWHDMNDFTTEHIE